MSPKINPGQFQKMTRRYVTDGWFGYVTVHAMTYEREGRTWSTACRPSGFRCGGSMVPTTVDQPDIDCKSCLATLGDAV